MINKQSYQIQGMRQDNLVGTGFSTKFAHEIKNMRLNTIGDFTTASWTVEKGTLLQAIEFEIIPQEILEFLVNNANPYINNDVYTISFKYLEPIGQAVINDQWIVFATNPIDGKKSIDFIFKFWYANSTLMGSILYTGYLGFDALYPCETLTYYESENIQKVYWTDGKNPPRVININRVDQFTNCDSQFDFIPEVDLKEKVTITKNTDGAGLFPPCTVKYLITYFTKYGQESNIVYESPLYYPIKGDRGCSPDELSGDSFTIKVTNLDLTHNFDYIRLYSVVRTSDNATPIVKIVDEKELTELSTDYITFVDTNESGRVVDPSIVNYIGGTSIIAQTIEQKNNTLFLGNISITNKAVTNILQDSINLLNDNNAGFITGSFGTIKGKYGNYYKNQYETAYEFAKDNAKLIGIRTYTEDKTFYQYSNQLTASKFQNCYYLDPDFPGKGDEGPEMITLNGNSQKIKIFKYNEYYKFGIQFQDNTGHWSEVMPLKNGENYEFQNTVKPDIQKNTNIGRFGVFQYTLKSQLVSKLLNNNYIRARLVCCYPNNFTRTILTQGVINPTIKNTKWADSHAPDVLASWFFRPKDTGSSVETIPYRDNLKSQTDGNCEIQSIVAGLNDSVFSVNNKVLTFNSPEISFDESIRTLPLENVTNDIVGYVPIQSYASGVYAEATAPFPSYNGVVGTGLSYPSEIKYFNATDVESGTHFVNTGEWDDRNYWAVENDNHNEIYHWILYPFHRKGSLTNYVKDVNPWTVEYSSGNEAPYKINSGSVLQSKCLSHLLYSSSVIYSKENNTPDLDSKKFTIFDSKVVCPLKLSSSIYYGNVNSIAPVSNILDYITFTDKDNKTQRIGGSYRLYRWDTRKEGSIDTNGPAFSSDPVPITFNSTAHAVFCSNNYLEIINGETGSQSGQKSKPYLPNEKPYLPIIDIKQPSSVETRLSDKPRINNIFVPCGPVVDLRECLNNGTYKSPVLLGIEGDHYFMRYDCLKTYPRSSEDINQIVEILSYACETRINLDGRYDKNRGLSDNTTINDTNFNLINNSYTQSNNLFSYTILEKDDTVLDTFSNQITWTKDKINGEDIDTWTNLTLANVADADGTCGEITKIINFNDSLYAFQEHGICQIGYNEKTAISTTEGIPIELANSGKFTGFKYITKEFGCQNKWSINLSKNGVLFIDDSRQEILSLSPELTSISTKYGFDAFMIDQLKNSYPTWNPHNFTNFITYYDKLGNDIFFINKHYCLAWNEQSQTFTSFYDYNNIPLMANIDKHLLLWSTKENPTFVITKESESYSIDSPTFKNIYAARESDTYSKFFDVNKDYWMTIVCDGMTDKGSAFPADKVFNNIEYRADIFNMGDNISGNPHSNYHNPMFNIKHVWNGYQNSQEVALDGERKFNTWRVQLPRHYGTRDRIRNPFCYIKLKQDQTVNTQTDRMILHDLAVYFDIR